MSADVLTEVAAERARQDKQWRQQNHPDGTGPAIHWGLGGPAFMVRDTARDITQFHASGAEPGLPVTWLDILREEVAEAFAEADPARLRAELIQIAAVAVQWVQAIDRRHEQPAGKCPKCDGCGRIATDDEDTPWSVWENLPVRSAASVILGMVKPVTCPACSGSGSVTR